MSSIEVRPFRRSDREQLTALVNAHVGAVVPGASVSVNAVLSQLEREPGEFIVDPWVAERATLVAEQRGRVVAAAHLLRYGTDEEVGRSYRGAGEIRWFLFWPEAPYWPDIADARDALLAASLAQLERWRVSRQLADGSLPAPGVYGVPEQWPHVRAAYEQAGFVHEGRIEVVYLADVAALAGCEAEAAGATLARSLGINGTRLSAVRRDEVLGFIEVDTLEDANRLPRQTSWAEIGNFHVEEAHGGAGIEEWLLAQAGRWLALARAERLLAYASPDEAEWVGLLERSGFELLARTQRGWTRSPN